MRILLLRLEGVLQSWGEGSRWDNRNTTDMPTKSGIIGLIGCAMGIPRGDERLNQIAQALVMASRADRDGTVLSDFHTVQSKSGMFPNAAGVSTNPKDTIITPREYMQDACYTVFLTGNDEWLSACEYALRHPVWVPSLGRRSCPPSRPLLPIMTEAYETLEDAVQLFRWETPPVRGMAEYLRVELDDPFGQKERTDLPVNSSVYAYRKRRVRTYSVENRGDLPCI